MFSNSELVGHLGRSMGMTKSRSNSGASRPSTKPPIFKAVRLPREAPVRLKSDPIRGEERVEVEFKPIVATRDEITHSVTKSKRFYGGASNDEDGMDGWAKEREKANQPTKMNIDPDPDVVDSGQRFDPPVRPQRPPVHQVHVRSALPQAPPAPPLISREELDRANARAAAAEAAVAAVGSNVQRLAGRAHESEMEAERTRTLFSEENKRISDELASARAKVLELQSAHHSSAKGRASAEQQAAAAREHIKTLAAELGELRQKESQLEKLSAALQKSNEAAEAAHAKAEAREKGWQLSAANEARAVKRAQELEVQIAQLQADNGALAFRSSATADSSKDALRELATRNGALEASRIQLNDEKFRISEELVQMREKVQDLESKHHSSARARAAAEAQTEEAHKHITALTNEMRELRQKETQLVILEKDNVNLRADKGALAFRSSASSDAHRNLSFENQQLKDQLAAYQRASIAPLRVPIELPPLVARKRGRPQSAGAQLAAFAALGGPEAAREQALSRSLAVQQQLRAQISKRPVSAGSKRTPLILPPPKFGALGAPPVSSDIVPGASPMDDIDDFTIDWKFEPAHIEAYNSTGQPTVAWVKALAAHLRKKTGHKSWTEDAVRRNFPGGQRDWERRFELNRIGRDSSPPKMSMPPKKKAHV